MATRMIKRPLTRPAPAGESAGSGTPSPQGRGLSSQAPGLDSQVRGLDFQIRSLSPSVRGHDYHIQDPRQSPESLRLTLPFLARPNLFGGD